MALVRCGEADVIHAELHLSTRGAWSGEVVLDAGAAPTGSVSLRAEGGLELQGTVVGGGVFLDVAAVRIVGGAGGLATEVEGAYQLASLRDPLDTIMSTSGERLSGTIAPSILAVPLERWTLGRSSAAKAIDDLVAAASAILEQALTWRVIEDGSIWIGAEAWPSASLPDTADVLVRAPVARLIEIGVETPALLPGVNLEGVGRVVAVDHWITPHEVRTWAWTRED